MRVHSLRLVLMIVCFACFQSLTQAQYSFEKIEGPRGGAFQNVKMTTDGYLFSLTQYGFLYRGNSDGTWLKLQSLDSMLSYQVIGNRIIALDWGSIQVSTDQGQTFSKKYTLDRNTIFDRFERFIDFPDNTLSAYFFKSENSVLQTNFLISHDLGESWIQGTPAQYLGGLVTDKNGTVFSTNWSGVYKSTDQLNSFQKVSDGSIYSLANKGNKLYAIFGDSLNLFSSVNGGATWHETSLALPGCGYPFAAYFLTQFGDEMYLVNEGRVYKFQEQPLSWQLLPGLPVPEGEGINGIYNLQERLYISTSESLYRGQLNWANWEEIVGHEVLQEYSDLSIDDNQIFVSTFARIYKSPLEHFDWSVSLSKNECSWGYPNKITKIGNDSTVVFSNDLIYTSINGGDSWSTAGTAGFNGYTELINGEFYSNSTGYTKHILKLNNSTQAWEYFNQPWNESWDITSQFYTPEGYKQIIGKSATELFLSGKAANNSYKIFGWNPTTDQLREIGTVSSLFPVQAAVINNDFYILGPDFPYQPNYSYRLLKLSNSNSWEEMTTGESYLGYPKLSVKDNFVLILNLKSQLTLSDDYGQTWQTYSFPNVPTGASVDSAGNVYIAVSKSGIYKSNSRFNALSFELKQPVTHWFDANNDSLLDISIVGQNLNQVHYLLMQGTGVDTLENLQSIPSGYASGKSILTDFNRDNKIDIVISGQLLSGATSTDVFLNKGDFVFEKSLIPISDKAFQSFLFSDLNNDGAKELIGSDETGLYIYENDKSNLILKKDTAVTATSLQIFDFDRNGYNDIAFSGFSANQPITMVWFMQNGLKLLKSIYVAPIGGTLEAGDINHDSYFELAIAGENAVGDWQTGIFKNDRTSFNIVLGVTGLDSASIRIADFTSDGLADIAFFGKTSTGEKVNWIRTFSGDSIPLPTTNVNAQDFGDYDRDGDLDWVQIMGDSLKVFNNNLGLENKGPGSASGAIGLPVYNRTFFYWEKSSDDHSNSNSITYDMRVFNPDSTIIAADFDNINRHRLLVSHGNMGTANFSLQNIQGNYSFEIQAIDNSFTPQVNSVCSGVCTPCGTIEEENIVACGTAPVLLTSPAPQAMWFSFSKGFMGVGDSFSAEGAKADTIFSFNPAGNLSCSSLRVFNIKVTTEDTIRITHIKYDCQDRNITMEIASEWGNVIWKNNLNNSTASGQSLVHNLEEPITFRAYANNNYGCQLKEEFNLKLSKPDLQVGGTHYQVISGSSVSLSASGGSFYLWTPGATLDDNQIANPTATPEETTEYKVTAYDSLGCEANATILVEVFEEAFIPTLFTPNGDGRNDNLKIYGLTQANGFHFTIYNREGNKLFDTSSVDEATQSGWSGAVNGHVQPPGTYYWKVEGSMPKGDLLLSGKKSGVFLLVR